MDLESTARSILRDWNSGRIPYYTAPPAAVAVAPTGLIPIDPSTEPEVSASIVSNFAPEFDLDAFFGEADAEALQEVKPGRDMKGAVRMQVDEETVIDSATSLRLLGEVSSDDESEVDANAIERSVVLPCISFGPMRIKL